MYKYQFALRMPRYNNNSVKSEIYEGTMEDIQNHLVTLGKMISGKTETLHFTSAEGAFMIMNAELLKECVVALNYVEQ